MADGQLFSLKTITAENIIAALGIKRTEEKVKAVEQHIEDEMAAIQTHFAMAVQDVQHAYNEALAEVKSAYSFVASNRVLVIGSAFAIFIVGAVLGHIV